MRDVESQPSSSAAIPAASVDSLRAPRRLELVAILLVGLIAIVCVLAVNIFPAIGNDSVVYIEHSLDLVGGGFVVDGFRQVGYPAFLALVRGLSDLVGAEPLLTMALVQRVLLVCAAGLAFWAWRWWSIPLVIFLLAPATLAYSNLLLTESLALPLAILMVFPTVAFLAELRTDSHSSQHRRLLVFGLWVAGGALLLYGIRFTFAVFGAIPLVLAMASWKTPYRRLGIALLTGFLVLAGSLTLALSMENEIESELASPSANDGRAEYFYVWLHVFRRIPETRDDPALAEYYDDGEIYDFERQLSANNVPFAARRDMFATEISAMLAAADISEFGSKLGSMAWGLAGGRLHDVSGAVFGIVHSTTADVDRWTYLNSYAIDNGPAAFANRYNEGLLPQVVLTDPMGVSLPVPDGQSLAMVLVPLAILVMLVGLRYDDSRWVAVCGLLVVLGTAVGMGWIRADNFRFLMVSSAFGIASATSLMPLLAGRWTNRKAEVPVAMMGAP